MYKIDDFSEDTTVSYEEALIYAGGMIALNGIFALISNQIFLMSLHCGMTARIAVCSLIYRKTLRLSQTAFGETASGKVVNLLSNDVSRFDYASMFVNSLWVSPIILFIATILIWYEIGMVGLFGVLTIVSILPFMCK